MKLRDEEFDVYVTEGVLVEVWRAARPQWRIPLCLGLALGVLASALVRGGWLK